MQETRIERVERVERVEDASMNNSDLDYIAALQAVIAAQANIIRAMEEQLQILMELQR